MRTTAVPAQVTTVEDRIAGNLGMGQVVLLFIPIIVGSLLYAGLPPVMHSAPYKLVILTVLLCTCCLLAIRIKDKIVLLWAVVLLRYWLRPRYYVYDKHSSHGREQYRGTSASDTSHATETTLAPIRKITTLPFDELIRVRDIIENPGLNFVYEMRKGGLYVRITEIER